jgi:4'-phosphopantetheinyl transferase
VPPDHRHLVREDIDRVAAGDLVLAIVSLDPPQADVASLHALLSGDERERAARFVFERDRVRFAVARGTLRALLGRFLDADPRSLSFAYGPHGKPALEGVPLAFNLSHSADLALIALAREGELGVDVEAIRERVNVDEVATTFAPPETAALLAVPEEARRDAFFVAWTRKEAYIKAIGTGFSLAPHRFVVSVAPDADAALLSTTHDERDCAAWSLGTLRPRPGFVASYALRRSRGGSFEVRAVDFAAG